MASDAARRKHRWTTATLGTGEPLHSHWRWLASRLSGFIHGVAALVVPSGGGSCLLRATRQNTQGPCCKE